MKKVIPSLVLGTILLVPAISHAQTVVLPETLKQQLIALLTEQIKVLQAQLTVLLEEKALKAEQRTAREAERVEAEAKEKLARNLQKKQDRLKEVEEQIIRYETYGTTCIMGGREIGTTEYDILDPSGVYYSKLEGVQKGIQKCSLEHTGISADLKIEKTRLEAEITELEREL